MYARSEYDRSRRIKHYIIAYIGDITLLAHNRCRIYSEYYGVNLTLMFDDDDNITAGVDNPDYNKVIENDDYKIAWNLIRERYKSVEWIKNFCKFIFKAPKYLTVLPSSSQPSSPS